MQLIAPCNRALSVTPHVIEYCVTPHVVPIDENITPLHRLHASFTFSCVCINIYILKNIEMCAALNMLYFPCEKITASLVNFVSIFSQYVQSLILQELRHLAREQK